LVILGLDISLNRTGYFVFESDTMEVLDYGGIPNEGAEEDKLLNIYTIIKDIVEKWKPEGCGIEKEFASRNPDVLMKLSHCHGCCLIILAQNKIRYTYYPVMTLKSETLDELKLKKEDGTRKTGDELKEEVAEKIFDIFGKDQFIKPFKTDETDAASAAYVYYKLNGEDIVKKKKEAKKKAKKKKRE
jgi:Holliday junction resolvasome RuvABC endonuclease subunit